MSGPTRISLLRENAKREHTLYRLFDRDDNLLYVGITFMPGNRFRQHKREKRWWSEVARRETVVFPNRQEAEDAERDAIRAERPIYNSRWNGR